MALNCPKGARAGDKVATFVLKLRSLLDDPNSGGLIRWSEEGCSFIVIDKDRFAKTLLPEVFNHKNFASFVRQLNSYGFHKIVRISESSMRARECNPPVSSGYSHPQFLRSHPKLLSLIKTRSENKRKSPQKKVAGDAITGCSPTNFTIQAKDVAFLRDGLQEIQEQQQLIMDAINRLYNTQRDLNDRDVVIRRLHDQNQNSINAILNFIAILSPRNLNGHKRELDGDNIPCSQIMSDSQQPPDYSNSDDGGAHIENGMDVMPHYGDVLGSTTDPPLCPSPSILLSPDLIAHHADLQYLPSPPHDQELGGRQYQG